MNIKSIRRVSSVAIVVAVVVVMLGAYTRLTDAGLGCPDWPGCYGFVGVPETAEHIAQAEKAFPEISLFGRCPSVLQISEGAKNRPLPIPFGITT